MAYEDARSLGLTGELSAGGVEIGDDRGAGALECSTVTRIALGSLRFFVGMLACLMSSLYVFFAGSMFLDSRPVALGAQVGQDMHSCKVA